MRKHLAARRRDPGGAGGARARGERAAAATPKLNGTVGPGFTITLKKAGTKVTKLKAGKYTFVITDKASIHNFSLDGPNGLREDLHERALQGHEDGHADPQGRQVQVLLRAAREHHVRQLHRLVARSRTL